MASEDTSRAYFLRQRRNLILISLFVIFYKAGDLRLDKVELFGNETTIGNPQIVTFAVGCFFLYFLWRHYVYSGEMGGISNFTMACDNWAEERCRRYISRTHSTAKKKIPVHKVELITRKKWEYTFRIVPEDAYGKTVGVKVKWPLIKYRILSVIPVILKQSSFSEYVVPYILAILAIAEFSGLGVVECAMRLVGINTAEQFCYCFSLGG